jgi:hypothetical protein
MLSKKHVPFVRIESNEQQFSIVPTPSKELPQYENTH